MQCLTPNECSQWPQQRGIIESPYGIKREAMTFQFEPPRSPRMLTAFIRQLFDVFGEFPGALLQFTDWSLYKADEMALITSLRRSHGEDRWLIEAPGHLFAPAEAAEAIGHCYLACIFDWSAYLYLASKVAIIYFWEGELIDYFGFDQNISNEVREVVKNYDLRVTYSA